MANNENNKTQKPEEIPEINVEDLAAKEPWWKKALKIGGYVISGAVGLIAGLVIGNHMGDDDDDSPAEDHPTEE